MPAHLYCHSCGTAYATVAWPRSCSHCGRVTYRNPLPVAVVLQPVERGLLLVRRGLGVATGKLALPGGYLEASETWSVGAARELREETGLRIDPIGLRVCGVYSAGDDSLLIFALAPAIAAADLPDFVATAETLERPIADGPTDLAFSSHTAMMRRYFAGSLTTLEGC